MVVNDTGTPSTGNPSPSCTTAIKADSPDVSTLLLIALTAPSGTVVYVARGVSLPASGLSIDVPSETALVAPLDGATGVGHQTLFTTSPATDRVYTFRWEPQGPGPSIVLVTAEPMATIPDLAAYGLALPIGAPYEWACEVQGPKATVDDFVSERAGAVEVGEGFGQHTPKRTFGTGP